jgi:hypothetical protein
MAGSTAVILTVITRSEIRKLMLEVGSWNLEIGYLEKVGDK